MIYFIGCVYIFVGIGSALFYIQDMKKDKYKPVTFWILMALFLPPLFWIIRSLIGAFFKL